MCLLALVGCKGEGLSSFSWLKKPAAERVWISKAILETQRRRTHVTSPEEPLCWLFSPRDAHLPLERPRGTGPGSGLLTQRPLSPRLRSGEVGSCFRQWWPQPLLGPLAATLRTWCSNRVFPLLKSCTQPRLSHFHWNLPENLIRPMSASPGSVRVISGSEGKGFVIDPLSDTYGSLFRRYLLREDFPNHTCSPCS